MPVVLSLTRSALPARPCPDAPRRTARARSTRRRRAPGSGKRRDRPRSAAHCTFAGRGRCRRASERRRTGRRPARAAASGSSAAKPSAIQCRYQALRASSSWPSGPPRYLSTRRLLSGWMSQAISSAMPRTCARSAGSSGVKRGLGAGRVEIVDDREALGQALAVDIEHRHEALRIARAIVRLLLRAGEQIDRHRVVADPLEVERDPHAVAGRRAIIIEQDGLGHAVGLSNLAACLSIAIGAPRREGLIKPRALG